MLRATWSRTLSWGALLLGAGPLGAQRQPRQALELSPVSPLIHIYALQYVRRVGAHTEAIVGADYTKVKYDHGRSHAPGLIAGGRYYVWKGLHGEYQLWPGYNWYYENVEQKYYAGPEVRNEIRPGYTLDFRLAGQPVLVNLQGLVGFALYRGNKPQSFKDQVAKE